MEPRSFAQEPFVGEFVRVNPKGKTDRQLIIAALKQAEATHGCLESVGQDVLGVKRQVGGLIARQDVTDGRLTALGKMFGTEDVEEGEDKPAPPSTRLHLPIKELLKIVSGIGGSMAVFIFLFQFLVKIGPAAFEYIMGLSVT